MPTNIEDYYIIRLTTFIAVGTYTIFKQGYVISDTYSNRVGRYLRVSAYMFNLIFKGGPAPDSPNTHAYSCSVINHTRTPTRYTLAVRNS